MTVDIASLVSDNLHVWTSSVERKSGAGRGGGKKLSLYGIKRLRALILDLAVRGKVVPQDAEDEPAFKLLERIKSAKAAYLSDHGLPKQRPLTGHIEQTPFELPASWAWTRLGDIAAYIQRGKSPKYSDGSGVFVVSQRCVQWAGLDLSVAKEISRASLNGYEAYRFLLPDDLLWNSTGTGTIGRVIALSEIPDGLVCDSHVTLVRCPWVNARYLQSWLASDAVYGQIEVLAAGSTNQIEWTAQLATAQLIPLPPLAEQQRIVAKVDELMALCDALEAESSAAMGAHQALVEALLTTLVTSKDAADLAFSWARMEAHFDTLFTTEASIDALKQTILELAVRGKLVRQVSDEEQASVLLKAIKKSGSDCGTKQKSHPTITVADQPFDLPDGWCWERFDNLIDPGFPIAYGVLVPGPDQPDGIPFVRIADLSITEPSPLPEKAISPEVDAQFYRTRLVGGEILMGVVGSIGKLGVAPASWAGANIARAICRIVPSPLLDRAYFLWLLQSSFMQGSFSGDTRTLAQPTLNIGLIRLAATPVPPLAEQQRIVAKINELMVLCEALQAVIGTTCEAQKNLADTVVELAAA